jgi:hypothetical protein
MKPAQFHDAIRRAAECATHLPYEAARRQETYDLQGLGPGDGPSPYDEAENLIEDAIAKLRTAAEEINTLRRHRHEWGDNDYCQVCGADGRA